jgi:1,4-alpha-glucan branching enzyme
LVFIFNFHPNKSFADYPVGINEAGTYKIVLSSDDLQFGGENRIDLDVLHFTKPESFANRSHKMLVYIPCRCANIYERGINI